MVMLQGLVSEGTVSIKDGVNPLSNPTFNELFAAPDRYKGREILLEGFYFHGWESNLLSQSMEPSGFAEGHLWPQGQRLWVEGSMPTEVYEQLYQQHMMGPLERYGKVRIEGIFEYQLDADGLRPQGAQHR